MRFESPHMLWLLPVLPGLVLLFRWWSDRTRQRLLRRFVQARLLSELTVGLSTSRQRTRVMLFASAAALIVISLGRPQWGFTWQEARQRGLDIVVAVDTSKSMLAEDIKPNRLARAKLAALDLMQQAQADRLGIVAFAGGAFLQCPLTLDDGAFRQCIDELNVNILPQGGTALAEAIRTTIRAFKDNDNFKVLVLFSDGEDHDPGALEAAREASEAGMRIFTVGLGTEEGEILRIHDEQGHTDYVRDSQGQVVKSRLNETILQQIAGAAQGFYLPLRGADTVDTLYEKGLAPLPKSESEARLYQHYHEQFHWPLGLAVALFLMETLLPERKRESSQVRGSAARTAVAGLAVIVLLSGNHALASVRGAAREYRSGNYARALQEFDQLREEHQEDPRLHFNAGAAAFRAGEFEGSAQRYGLATGAPDLELQQQAYYNRGNAHYRIGEHQAEIPRKKEAWQQAISDYESALKLNPDDQDARFNLEFVKKRLEEFEQQQEQQQEKQEDQQNNQQSQDKEQEEQSAQDRSQDQQDKSGEQQQERDQGDSGHQDQQRDQQAQDQSGESGEEQQSETTQQQQGSERPESQDETQQNAQGQPMQPPSLTPEQAAQLLDNLQGEEQMLPLRYLIAEPKQPPAKDW